MHPGEATAARLYTPLSYRMHSLPCNFICIHNVLLDVSCTFRLSSVLGPGSSSAVPAAGSLHLTCTKHWQHSGGQFLAHSSPAHGCPGHAEQHQQCPGARRAGELDYFTAVVSVNTLKSSFPAFIVSHSGLPCTACMACIIHAVDARVPPLPAWGQSTEKPEPCVISSTSTCSRHALLATLTSSQYHF